MADALKALEQAVALSARSGAGTRGLGTSRLAQPSQAGARSAAGHRGPIRDHAARQVAVGLAQGARRHWDLAVLTLGGALELNPNELDIYRALGKVWLERPRDGAFLSKARKALETRGVRAPPRRAKMLTLYGRAPAAGSDVDGPSTRCSRDAALPRRSQASRAVRIDARSLNHLEPAARH